MKKTLFTILFVCLASLVFAQGETDLNKLMKERGEYYFSLNVNQPSEIQSINKICSVDKVDGQSVICYANDQQYEVLLKQGYTPTLLTPPSMQNEARMWDQRGTYEWNSYLTYGDFVTMMEGFPSTALSDRSCTLVDLGTLSTSNHRRILGVRINNGSPNGKPRFLYTSATNRRFFIGFCS